MPRLGVARRLRLARAGLAVPAVQVAARAGFHGNPVQIVPDGDLRRSAFCDLVLKPLARRPSDEGMAVRTLEFGPGVVVV